MTNELIRPIPSLDWKHWVSLPTEIVREIFLRCAMHVERFDSGSDLDMSLCPVPYEFCTPSIRYSPLNISHVCRWWRDLTLSMPELWTSLALTDRLQDPTIIADLGSTWLARSGRLPLSLGMKVNLGIRGHHAALAECIGNTMLAAALPFLPRWNRVWVNIPYLSSFPLHFNNTLTMLKHLHLGSLPLSNLCSILQCADNLQQMTLNFAPGSHRLATGSWPMLNFQLVDTLNHFPSLTHAQFTAWSTGSPALLPLPPFPYLTHLNCKLDEDSTRLLNHLILPSLRSLTIACEGAELEAMVSLIRRSSCNLTRLSIKSPLSSERHLLDLLIQTPSLLELRILSAANQLRAISGILTALCDLNIIPRVETIHLELLKEVSAVAITSFLEARKDGALKSCHLVFDFVSKGTMLWNHMKAAAPVVSFSYDERFDLSTAWSDEWGAVAL